MKQQILAACAVVWSGLALAAAQENGHIPVSMVEDWNSRHVIFSEEVARENRGAVLADPRFWHQYLRRHATRPLPAFDGDREREHERDSDRDSDRDHDRGRSPRKTQEGSEPPRLELSCRRGQRRQNLGPGEICV